MCTVVYRDWDKWGINSRVNCGISWCWFGKYISVVLLFDQRSQNKKIFPRSSSPMVWGDRLHALSHLILIRNNYMIRNETEVSLMNKKTAENVANIFWKSWMRRDQILHHEVFLNIDWIWNHHSKPNLTENIWKGFFVENDSEPGLLSNEGEVHWLTASYNEPDFVQWQLTLNSCIK